MEFETIPDKLFMWHCIAYGAYYYHHISWYDMIINEHVFIIIILIFHIHNTIIYFDTVGFQGNSVKY